MFLKIEPDRSRFKQIIRGRIKKELRRFIRQGELIGKQGNENISIPLPQIELPHFMYGPQVAPGRPQGILWVLHLLNIYMCATYFDDFQGV